MTAIKTMFYCLVVITFVVGSIVKLTHRSARNGDRASADRVVMADAGDPALDAAHRRARQTLPNFFAAMLNPERGMRNFSVKIGLPSKFGDEMVWITSLSSNEGQMVGSLDTSPELATEYQVGQTLQFSEAAIVDWTYEDSSGTKGDFTACVLASKTTARERAAYNRRHRANCS